MTSEEIWKPVVGYEGKYSVSNLGNIRSEDRVIITSHGQRRRYKGKIISPAIPTIENDYLRVNLWSENKGKTHTVHSVVAEAFLGPRPDGMETCHKSGIRSDNSVANLYYGTKSQNMRDRINHGNHAPSEKETCKYGHKLGGANSAFRSGRVVRGNCRACANARSRIFDGRGRPEDFQEIADDYYRKNERSALSGQC